MSDYIFLGYNSPVSANTGLCTKSSDNTIETANVAASTGDVVYLKIDDTTGVVAVAGETPTEFTFDNEIYSSVPASFTPTLAYLFTEATDILSDDVGSYRISTEIEVGT